MPEEKRRAHSANEKQSKKSWIESWRKHFWRATLRRSRAAPLSTSRGRDIRLGIYADWAWFGVPIVAAILANGVLAVGLRRREPRVARSALISLGLIAVSLDQPGDRAKSCSSLAYSVGDQVMPWLFSTGTSRGSSMRNSRSRGR